MSFLGISRAQKPLFDDALDMDKFKGKSAPRSFDGSRLIMRTKDGGLKDLRESSCYQEIGFNPDLSDDQILRAYEDCESEKRAKKIWTGVSVLLVGGFLWLLIRSSFQKNPKQTEG